MELLSPAGSLSSAYAAYKGGADAIYLGGKAFSARASAANFTNEEIEEITCFAHSCGKKVYVTLNTLLYQDEFMEAVEFARFLYSVNVDGVIIQDLGLAHYLHEILPDLPLNASTQLNCHNLAQAKALIKIGFRRIVLAREADIDFIRQVKALGTEVEVFGHGALCVCYSGNCLLSSFIGDRSGNRGRCAQPCRMNYDLNEDGKTISKDTFAISTKDLMTIDHIQEFVDAGVDSLKLEGRLKSDEYIYMVSKAYRDAIDKASDKEISQDKLDLVKIFNRKFTSGYVFDASPFEVLNTSTSSHQGELIGRVVSTYKNRVAIKLLKDVNRLDGIRFNGKEQFGLTIEKMFVDKNPVEQAYKGQIIELSGIDKPYRLNDLEVIRTKDYLLTKKIENEIKGSIKVKVNAFFEARLDRPIHLVVSFNDVKAEGYGLVPDTATGAGTTPERIKAQLCKTGEYPYSLENVRIEADTCFIPIAELNRLRNETLERLKAALVKTHTEKEKEYINRDFDITPQAGVEAIVETQEQKKLLEAENIVSYSNEDEIYRSELRVSRETSFSHPFELMNFIVENKADSYMIASPYCNITNSYALDCFYESGFKECMLSSELDASSMEAMIDDYKERHDKMPSVSILAYGKLDMMIMKSCPIGTVYHNKGIHCQRCHNHDFELVDRIGVSYHLVGDRDCNIRVLNDKPICLFDRLNYLSAIGIEKYYLLFTDEDNEKMGDVLTHLENRELVAKSTKGHFNRRPM